MKSHSIAKSFAEFLAKKINSTPVEVEALMSGVNSGSFSADVSRFVDHAVKTIAAFNAGHLKQRHVNEIFSDIEYLGVK